MFFKKENKIEQLKKEIEGKRHSLINMEHAAIYNLDIGQGEMVDLKDQLERTFKEMKALERKLIAEQDKQDASGNAKARREYYDRGNRG